MASYEEWLRRARSSLELAKLLSFGEKDIKNGNLISHEDAKKIFEERLNVKKQLTGIIKPEKINEVYEKIDPKEFEPYLNAGLEPVRKLTKNDSW